MILSDRDILKAIDNEDIKITPSPSISDIQPASIDLHLGDIVKYMDNSNISIEPGQSPMYRDFQHHTFELRNNQMLLGFTKEKIELNNNLVARVEGKSSLGRAGLAVHITAGFIDPGFKGNVTLEIVNHSGHIWNLKPNMKICQIAFEELTSPSQRPYGHKSLKSKYQNQNGVVGSNLENI
jgi:dCTP deaminase